MDSGLRVAIADDDQSVRRILQQLLQDLGHDVVVVADNGHSLIKECAAARPDVVITDNLMPGMKGLDAAAEIYRTQPIPIILLSGFCDRQAVLEAEQKHVFLYLVKPISQPHLEVALARCREHLFTTQRSDNRNAEVLVTSARRMANGSRYHAWRAEHPLRLGIDPQA